MPTIELPDFWLLVNPDRVAVASIVSVRLDNTVHAVDADAAWKQFTPKGRDRKKEARDGWRVIGVDHAGFDRHMVAREPVPSDDAEATEPATVRHG